MKSVLEHLEVMHDVFINKKYYSPGEVFDHNIYQQNEENLRKILKDLSFENQLYQQKGRQMILADFFEYIFLGRGYYSMQSKENKENFVKAILFFVNMLMCYEMMTVSDNLRRKFLKKLIGKISYIKDEKYFDELKNFIGSVGLKSGELLFWFRRIDVRGGNGFIK